MKSLFRDNILGRLKLLSAYEKAQASSAIQFLLKQSLVNESGVWAGYQSLMHSEPHIDWSQVSNKIEWAFPVTSENKLEFKKNVQNYSRKALGFLEPQDGESVSTEQISGFVIPGLAFDRAGYRLGRGKGYYDQTLYRNNKKKIGVCFETAFCENVPHESHDLVCNQIITEKKVHQVEGDQKC
ncbi:MAG: 5-formyltetrahydrofolate cyclo-ligase [Pseudobdellovibrio sp.]